MKLPYKTLITEEDVLNHLGYDIKKRLKADDQPDTVAQRFLTACAGHIYNLLMEITHNQIRTNQIFDSTDPYVIRQMEMWQLHQVEYVFENGLAMADSGTDGLLELSKLRDMRNYSPITKNLIITSGLVNNRG